MIQDNIKYTGTLDSQKNSNFKSKIYTLTDKIGEGGFGVVYKALNNKTQQFVAIKLLRLGAELTSEQRRRQIQRFSRETLLCSKLQHPNIVRLLDRGQYDNFVFAVFEFIEGKTLKEHLFSSGMFAPVQAAELMAQILDALAHAHSMGIVHRDIKPANIMLTNVGARTHAKILDFGISALTHELRHQDYPSITLTQEILGTPSYSAPEQLRGEPPTPKSDLYVWGLVFIECLTGVPTINGSSLAAVFQKQLNPVDVPLPKAIAGHPVASLLHKVLNKNLSERENSALALYNSFTKIDFSTLVGTIINPANDCTNNQVNSPKVATTLITKDVFLQVNLTERKQITVMCITLEIHSVVGKPPNTSDYFEQENVQTLRQELKKYCINLALRYGAMHAGTLADTLLFYFGYPMVSDQDCRLCARTALEITNHLNQLNILPANFKQVFSAAHIGIHCGLITVDGHNLPEGETPNIAMTLARNADANQILCTNSTRKILQSHFEFTPHKSAHLSVQPHQETLHSLIGIRTTNPQIERPVNRSNRHFIGRQQELQTLTGLLFNNAKDRYVHLYGEAGIGKSRIIFELRQHATHFSHIESQCLPEFKNQALHPILELLKCKYSLNWHSETQALTLLRKLLSQQSFVEPTVAITLLSSYLRFALPESFCPDVTFSIDSKKILFESLSYLLCLPEANQSSGRYLFTIENMHWADQSTLEFINSFVTNPLFINTQHVFVSTSRQTLPTLFTEKTNVQFEVQRFTHAQSQMFIAQLFDKQTIAKELLDLIIERTDGIPLFLVKLVDMLKHKKHISYVDGKISLVTPPHMIEVPEGLRDTLQQKLDNLPCAKKITQLASVMGREFDLDLLKQSSGHNEEQLQGLLNELLQAELIYIQHKDDGKHYLFKNLMLRETAYDSMPQSMKREAHKLISYSLENRKNKISIEDIKPLAVQCNSVFEHKSMDNGNNQL
ncbi:TOMM system kinase/cyclase fusion protein [Paraglaciecola sp.]|uniref:TOMM system kinase/cyclase fusion protein n=1 Tax=Paraglaciecola sp. TaxID=1920173 RepID=UPI0030F406D2